MINHYTGVGRLTRDPEIRKTMSGKSVLSFTIAINRKPSSDNRQEADFISCVAWNRTAELIDQFCRKGSQIGVEGSLRSRNYKDPLYPDRTVYAQEVQVEMVTFLDTRNNSNNGNNPTVEFATEDNYYLPIDSDYQNLPSDDLPF